MDLAMAKTAKFTGTCPHAIRRFFHQKGGQVNTDVAPWD